MPDESVSSEGGDTLHPFDQPERDLTGATLGDFAVERLLGRGGMGEVYLARQVSLNRPAALKVLRPDLLKKPVYLSRFEAEAAAVAKINHPNIVTIYTLGSTEAFRFIAMEYVQGTNLREYIRKKGALDLPLALSIMRQSALAVGVAGELGLVHRDIKPENILLTRKGLVKVADFGLCRDLDSEGVHLTQTGVTLGTPLYMSPEQSQGHPLDHRSDLYSLGVTFYHMLAGVPPFKAESAIALALKHVRDKPASLTVHRRDLPPELDRLVLKLMAKSPGDRFQSAAEMLRDLARVREQVNAPTVVQPAVDLPGPSAPGPSSTPSVGLSLGGLSTPASAGVKGARSLRAALAASAIAGEEAGTSFRTRALPALGPWGKAALVATGLALGALAGWLARPEDLLAARAAAGPGPMPGLWIDPRWRDVARAASAQDQYDYAQVRSPEELLTAAWLAVPGHFPNSLEWSSRAYTQLARRLLRQRDAEGLKVLAREIDRWNADGRGHEKALAAIIRAGVQMLGRDFEGMLTTLDQETISKHLTDPALLDLGFAVVEQADRMASLPGTSNPSLAVSQIRDARTKLAERLAEIDMRDHPSERR